MKRIVSFLICALLLCTLLPISAMAADDATASSMYLVKCEGTVVVKNASGKTLKITVNNQSEKNIYVESATLDGRPLDLVKISHADIAQGGELVFNMTDKV